MSMKKDVSKFSRMNPRAGFSILEPLLAASLVAFLTLGLVSALVYGQTTVADNAARGKALFLADEGLEAVRSIRSVGFAELEEGTHGLVIEAGLWSFFAQSDTTDGFERSVEIIDMDDSSKQIISSVAWTASFGTTTVSIDTRLYEWQPI